MQQVNQTGIIPSQVTSQLNAIARSSSPDVVKQGSTLFNALYDTDPASVGDMPKDMQSFYLTVKQLTDSGMASDEAVKQAQNVTYNQTDALKSQLSSTQSTEGIQKRACQRDGFRSQQHETMVQLLAAPPQMTRILTPSISVTTTSRFMTSIIATRVVMPMLPKKDDQYPDRPYLESKRCKWQHPVYEIRA